MLQFDAQVQADEFNAMVADITASQEVSARAIAKLRRDA
jgi:hypothetical protein